MYAGVASLSRGDNRSAEGGQLSLLERVIKESMRLLPPVPWNARQGVHFSF
jgi:cytochrome P450